MKHPSSSLGLVGIVFLVIYKDGIAGEQLSDYLWQQTEQYHRQALASKYITEIRDVSLDPIDFGAYNLQDAIYLYYFKESIDIAASRTMDTELKQFLQNKSKSHEEEYKAAFKAWHISDPSGIKLGSECQNYVNHLLNVAKTMDGYYLVAALIPCSKLWPWLGHQIGAESVNIFYFFITGLLIFVQMIMHSKRSMLDKIFFVTGTDDNRKYIFKSHKAIILISKSGLTAVKIDKCHNKMGKFGVYNNWVRANLDPTYVGYTKYEKVINDGYTKGAMTKEKALQVYGESMMGEVAVFNSV